MAVRIDLPEREKAFIDRMVACFGRAIVFDDDEQEAHLYERDPYGELMGEYTRIPYEEDLAREVALRLSNKIFFAGIEVGGECIQNMVKKALNSKPLNLYE